MKMKCCTRKIIFTLFCFLVLGCFVFAFVKEDLKPVKLEKVIPLVDINGK